MHGFRLLLLIAVFSTAAFADTTWVASGYISGDWTADHSPYMIQGNINISQDSSLNIGPGVTVFFTGSYLLQAANMAHLNARGVEGDSVYFTADTLANPSASGGLYIYDLQDTAHFEYCVLENSRAENSLSLKSGALQMRHCAVRNCVAGDGALYARDVQRYFEVTECTFSGIRANYGAGICFAEQVSPTTAHIAISDCLFEHNTATSGGGAIDTWTTDSIGFVNCVFRDNSGVDFGGGAVMVEQGFASFTNCSFTDNSHPLLGGALLAYSPAHMQIHGCTFSGNQSTQGGAVNNMGNELLIENSVFDHNQATYGGALYNTSSTAPILRHCTIVANRALAHGGGIYTEGNNPALSNSIIAFNGGEGVRLPEPHAEYRLHHDLFFGNSLGSFLANFAPDTLNFVDRTNRNGDACDALSNLYLNPFLADTASADYHLTATSPCIDAGDPRQPLDPDSTITDIGAYYFYHHLKANPQFIAHPSPSSFLRFRTPSTLPPA